MKYIYPWEQPLAGKDWWYRRYPTTNVVINITRLNRSDEPDLWLCSHYPTPETKVSQSQYWHYHTRTAEPLMEMFDKFLKDQGFKPIPISAGHFL